MAPQSKHELFVAQLTVSAEFVRRGRVGGTEQALHYLLDGLSSAVGNERLVVVGEEVDVPDGVEIVAPIGSGGPRFVQESRSFRRWAPQSNAYYFPNYFTPVLPKPCRVITTIPDLQYVHLPANFTRRKRTWLALAHRLTLRRADIVTVYSNFVRADIADRYGTRSGRDVRVMPIPVSWDRFGDVGGHGPKMPYVLSVASHYHHKNLATLVRSFARVHERVPDLELVLVGQFGSNLVGVRRSDDVRALIEELGLGDVVHTTGYVTPHELGAWYRGAELFVFPSIFEGFGLPPVEALGFGLPVITTRLTSLPEVTLGYAEYVDDAFDADELADRIVAQIESGARPSAETVANIRETYAPARIGKQLYDLMTSGIA